MRAGPVLAVALGVALATSARAGDSGLIAPDVRMPFAVGWAYSGGMRSPALATALVGEVDFYRVHRGLDVGVALSIDSLSRPDVHVPAGTPGPGVLGLLFGGGLFWRPGGGLALGLGSGIGPVFRGDDVVGLALATRLQVWPRYLDVKESTRCAEGGLLTYVAGALSLWSEARVDFSDQSGGTLAFGGAFDVARGMILPLVGLAMHQACSRD